MRIDRKSLAEFLSGPICISLCAIEGAESRVRIRGTRIGSGSGSQFLSGFLPAALPHREDSKVVMRPIVFGSDCRQMRELLPRPNVILLQEPDGSQ